jgi:acyl-coenzyme A thioesterase PaaI-like protein
VAEGEILHGGKGLIVARSEIRDPQGKPLIVATASFMRRRIRDWVPVVTARTT